MRTWLLGGLAVLALAGLAGTYHQFRARTLAEGRAQVAEEMLDERLRLLNASEIRREQIEADAVIAIATADSLRVEAEGRAAEVHIVYREAEVRATAAGDSLAATLDSLMIVVPEELVDMVAVAERQHEAERLANREALAALSAALSETQLALLLSQEARTALEVRYAALEESFTAQGAALAVAEDAIQARTEQAEGPWYGSASRALLVLGSVGFGVLVSQ